MLSYNELFHDVNTKDSGLILQGILMDRCDFLKQIIASSSSCGGLLIDDIKDFHTAIKVIVKFLHYSEVKKSFSKTFLQLFDRGMANNTVLLQILKSIPNSDLNFEKNIEYKETLSQYCFQNATKRKKRTTRRTAEPNIEDYICGGNYMNIPIVSRQLFKRNIENNPFTFALKKNDTESELSMLLDLANINFDHCKTFFLNEKEKAMLTGITSGYVKDCLCQEAIVEEDKWVDILGDGNTLKRLRYSVEHSKHKWQAIVEMLLLNLVYKKCSIDAGNLEPFALINEMIKVQVHSKKDLSSLREVLINVSSVQFINIIDIETLIYLEMRILNKKKKVDKIFYKLRKKGTVLVKFWMYIVVRFLNAFFPSLNANNFVCGLLENLKLIPNFDNGYLKYNTNSTTIQMQETLDEYRYMVPTNCNGILMSLIKLPRSEWKSPGFVNIVEQFQGGRLTDRYTFDCMPIKNKESDYYKWESLQFRMHSGQPPKANSKRKLVISTHDLCQVNKKVKKETFDENINVENDDKEMRSRGSSIKSNGSTKSVSSSCTRSSCSSSTSSSSSSNEDEEQDEDGDEYVEDDDIDEELFSD